jgi:hypothetical protein
VKDRGGGEAVSGNSIVMIGRQLGDMLGGPTRGH